MMAQPSVSLVVEAAAAATGLRTRDVIGHRRTEEFVRARKIAYLLAVDMTGLSFPAIGRVMGRDPTTVMSGEASARELYATDAIFRELVNGARMGIERVVATDAAALLADPDPIAVATEIARKPHIAAMLRVSARDTQAMALRLLALEATAAKAQRLLRLIDEICTGDIGPVRRRDLARETKGLIATLAAELTDLDIKETDDGKEEQNRSGEHPRAAE